MLCYVMLCCVMLCYVMLYYVMLCYVMLCYVMLCYVKSCYVMLCYVMLYFVMCIDSFLFCVSLYVLLFLFCYHTTRHFNLLYLFYLFIYLLHRQYLNLAEHSECEGVYVRHCLPFTISLYQHKYRHKYDKQ